MEMLKNAAALFGRVALSGMFFYSAYDKITDFGKYLELLKTQLSFVPMPQVALVVGIVVLLLGGLCLATGYRARLGAVILVPFTASAAVIYHAPWESYGDMRLFLTHFAVIGGLLMVAAQGAGYMALTQLGSGGKRNR